MTTGVAAVVAVRPEDVPASLHALRAVVDDVRAIATGDDVLAAAAEVARDRAAVIVTDPAGAADTADVLAVLAGVRDADAAVRADAVTDAVKRVRDGRVVASVDRARLALPRLPLALDARHIGMWREHIGAVHVDDLLPALLSGWRVRLVRGDEPEQEPLLRTADRGSRSGAGP